MPNEPYSHRPSGGSPDQQNEILNSTAESLNKKSASESPSENSSRREFLKKSSGAAAALPILSAGLQETTETRQDSSDLFQAEEHWRERIKAPDDGKRYGWFVDTRRCFGCHACEVSCKSENDVPLGNYIRQTIYKDVGQFPEVSRMFLPMACQHCEDAPCIKACPCGRIAQGSRGNGRHRLRRLLRPWGLVDVCPYGAIYMDPVANQAVKCHNCYHRLEHGMEPACACTCPSNAIYFGDLNDAESKVSKAMKAAEQEDLPLVQLRVEKQTRPRMWFTGPAPAEIESRVPREGKSYSPAAFDIYNWKEDDHAE
ncbi:MAG: 4Fe-4S dicluster domain-containing protein [Pirellulaceae bacterium]